MPPVSPPNNNGGPSRREGQTNEERDLPTPEAHNALDSMEELAVGASASDGGGVEPSSTPIRRVEPYYSNEDIELVNEIVDAGEEILAELPERERLPTNALFRAADLVLPTHGYESEDVPHISRLLFQIGGQRGDGTLLDKFRSVLAGMGIELEFVDSSITPASGSSELGASPLPRQDRSSSPSPLRYAPHRRRNSDSIVVSFVAPRNTELEGYGTPVPPFNRSHSVETPPDSRVKEVRFSDVVDAQSFHAESTGDPNDNGTGTVSPSVRRLPLRPKPAPAGILSDRINGLKNRFDGKLQTPPRPRRASAPSSPPRLHTSSGNRPAPTFGLLFSQDQLPDELPPYENQFQTTGYQNGVHPDGTPSDSFEGRVRDYDAKQNAEHFPDPSLSVHGICEAESFDSEDEEAEADDEDDLRRVKGQYSPVHLRRRSQDDVDNLTVEQFAFLKATEQDLVESTFGYWRQITEWTGEYHERAEEHAVQYDALEAIGDALQIWVASALTMHLDENKGRQLYEENARSEVPFDIFRQARPRVLSRGHHGERDHDPFQSDPSLRISGHESPGYHPDDDDLQLVLHQGPSPENEADQIMQYNLAAAAWDNFLLSKAFTHWAGRAGEEELRTRTARRHILRKRCFGAWIEQKDETEAQAKIRAFGQAVAIQHWRDISQDAQIIRESDEQLARRLNRRDSTSEAMVIWLREHKLKQAANMDERRLRIMCGEIWQSDDQWLTQAHDEADAHFRHSALVTVFMTWRTEARVLVRADDGAKPIIARRDEFLKSGLSLAWRHDAEESSARKKLAVDYEVSYLVKHWRYEAKLRQFKELQKVEVLDSVTYHWYCEWRLVLCKRIFDQENTHRFLERWADVAGFARERSEEMEDIADDMHHHNTVINAIETARDAVEDLEEQSLLARAIPLHRTVPKVINRWTQYMGWAQRMKNWGRLGRYYSVGEKVLDHWSAVRKQEWQRKMHKKYSDTRYRIRCDTLRDCLDAWRRSTAQAITSNWEADDMKAEDDQGLITGVLDGWTQKLEYIEFSTEVAEDSDKEGPLIIWSSLLEAQRENGEDALEYDVAQTLGEHWENLELASVQLRGKHHTVQEVKDHNDRRLRKQFFNQWAIQVASDRVPELDFRTSRRTARWTTPAPARSRMVVDYTPFRTPFRPERTERTPYYRPPSELTFEENEEYED